MKIERLIGIITILLQQDKITAPQLASRFEVSRRTINRDIEDICKAGIPLVTVSGYRGGISIAEGYKIDKSLLTNDELSTMLTGLKGIDSISNTSHLEKFTEKFSSRQNPIVFDDTIMIDLASHYQSSLTPKIELIKKAIFNRQLITFQYYSEKGDSCRTIEPYRLVFHWSSWYIFGYCLDRNDYRLFKLNRLWALKCCEDAYTARAVPSDKLAFDDHIMNPAIHLRAIFEKSEAYRLIEEYGVHCYEETEDGNLVFECDFAEYGNMLEWISSFGDHVLVTEPDRLKNDLLRQAEHILKKYKVT